MAFAMGSQVMMESRFSGLKQQNLRYRENVFAVVNKSGHEMQIMYSLKLMSVLYYFENDTLCTVYKLPP